MARAGIDPFLGVALQGGSKAPSENLTGSDSGHSHTASKQNDARQLNV